LYGENQVAVRVGVLATGLFMHLFKWNQAEAQVPAIVCGPPPDLVYAFNWFLSILDLTHLEIAKYILITPNP